MNGLAEHTGQTLEQRTAYIQDLCEKVKQAGEGQRIFATLDYRLLAKYAGSELIPYLALPVEDFVDKIVYHKGCFADMFERLTGGKEWTAAWSTLDGEALTPGEMASAVSSAITENRRNADNGGPLVTLVTTEDILFQFYLIKKTLCRAAQ